MTLFAAKAIIHQAISRAVPRGGSFDVVIYPSIESDRAGYTCIDSTISSPGYADVNTVMHVPIEYIHREDEQAETCIRGELRQYVYEYHRLNLSRTVAA